MWELLVAVALGGWIGFYLRDTLVRLRNREVGALWQARLELISRQNEKVARALRSESAEHEKALKMLDGALDASRQAHEASRGELSEARELARQLQRQVDALTTFLPRDQLKLLIGEEARNKLDSQAQAVESLTAEHERCRQRLEASQESLAVSEAHGQTLELQLRSAIRRQQEAAKSIEALKIDLTASHEALFKCDERVNQRETQIEQLQTQVAELLRNPPGEPPGQAMEIEARYLTLVAEKDQRIGDLEGELEQRDGRGGELERELERRDGQVSGLVQELERCEDKVRELEQSAPAPAAAKDDLRRIRGIGPALERQLNDLGVTSFQQIALWDDAEIERISAQLGRFRDRIRRDDWVGGAREQYRKKCVESSESPVR